MTVDALGLPPRDRPFAGPRPFGPGDAARFFGRARASAQVAGLWRSRRVTVLSGPSGAGLTSLLGAGVLPLLARDGADVLPVGRVAASPAVVPFLTPAGRNPLVTALLDSWTPPGGRTGPAAGRTIGEFLRVLLRDRAAEVPLLAAIDRAEDLLAVPGGQRGHLGDLLEQLSGALHEHPRLHLLLAVREAHRPALRPLAARLSGDEPAEAGIGFLERDTALEAVRRPLESTDRQFARGAAEYLLDELAVPPEDGLIAPALLQVCCVRIWSRVPAEVRSITAEHIHAYADVGRSLTDFVARVLAETAAEHRIGVGDLRAWLQRAFAGEHRAASGVSAAAAQAGGIHPGVLATLEDRHLLRSAHGPGGVRFVLYHERLAGPLAEVPGSFTAGDYLRSAELALAAGELELADKHVAEAEAAAPAGDRRLRADAERLRGDIAAERGRPETAEGHYLSAATLLEALQDTPGVGLLLAAIGRLQLARGLTVEAFDKLRAAADRLPADPGVQISLARALWGMGRPQAAVSVLTGLLSANGDTPDALRARGEFLADLGEAQRALRDLDRVPRNPGPAARAARALALATLQDWDHAREEIDAALAAAPGNGPVLLYAARIAELRGDRAAAADRAGRAKDATAPRLPRHQGEEADRLLGRLHGH
ncbi:tetratricopeptide repeat protein [Actinomadura macrotermitis]|uniref:tetratricopeptide repeat protein n=1 Tax=Actinomadura macrotermitis TaxID=2585200 RepID=UPI001296C7E3|nr:tetratricopeptide repeat protein [Actinomadura macrotermitis]